MSGWTPLTILGWVLTAVGFGVYIPFASEEADAQNAGEVVSSGIRAGVLIAGAVFLAGLLTMLAEGIRRGVHEGRLVATVAAQLGLAALAIVAGFAVMLVVVHIAFA